MRIYTRTGDKGETGLVGGKRVVKDSLRIEAIGTLDELNAALGVCSVHAEGTRLLQEIFLIQNWLFELGAELATPSESPLYKESVQGKHVQFLESSMDLQMEELEPLRDFIIPGGCKLAAYLHVARCICRRTERCILFLSREEEIRSEVIIFINRLSDWLFMAARTANLIGEANDVKWEPGRYF